MDFQDFLPKEEAEKENSNFEVGKKEIEKITQEQLYDMLTNNNTGWQAIIYELIQTEQLDPWDINLALLAQKYLEKIHELEEANFFVSSKMLLAASLLLRIKSEILLNRYIRSLDEILFGKKDEPEKSIERIEIDESELPLLTPKTPLPRFRQVTLNELMTALGKAINTEQRRIKREVRLKQAERLSQIDVPKTRVNIRDRIRKVYAKIKTHFKKKPKTKLGFTELTGNDKEAKITAFLPVLHLDNQHKIWLNQEQHFDEIWIWLYEAFKKNKWALDQFNQEMNEVEKELDNEQKKRLEKINKDFSNPLASFFDISSEIIKGDIK